MRNFISIMSFCVWIETYRWVTCEFPYIDLSSVNYLTLSESQLCKLTNSVEKQPFGQHKGSVGCLICVTTFIHASHTMMMQII